MSKFRTITTRFLDRDALVASLGDVGYRDVEVHDIAQNLYGYVGDIRHEKAHVIIRRKFIGGSSNDIGFVKGADGSYSAIISDFDSHKHGSVWVKTLTKNVAERTAMKTAKKMGFTLIKRTTPHGKTVLEVVR